MIPANFIECRIKQQKWMTSDQVFRLVRKQIPLSAMIGGFHIIYVGVSMSIPAVSYIDAGVQNI